MSQSRGDAPPRGAETPACRSRDGARRIGASPPITRQQSNHSASLWGHTSRTEINLPLPPAPHNHTANHTPPRASTITGARQSGSVCSARQHTVRRSSIQPDKFECGTCTAIVGCLHPPQFDGDMSNFSCTYTLTHSLTPGAMSVSPSP